MPSYWKHSNLRQRHTLNTYHKTLVNNKHNYSTVTLHNYPVHNCDKLLRTIATCYVDSQRQSVQYRTFKTITLRTDTPLIS